ncbi:MAG TPA: NAD(P)H-hydrate dehydratase [Azonexus sp.]|nr:NAD(P)H-hydrate dehydratase [Azonexus sp.]
MPTRLYRSASLRRIEALHASAPLLHRAGAAAADWAAQLATQRERPILVLAGPGNNGGDAFEAARLLRERFFATCVVFAGDPLALPTDAAAACKRFSDAGGITIGAIPDSGRWSLIIDGLFGIGLGRAPAGQYAEWIAAANALAVRDACPLLALDCPSGLDADTGQAFNPCIRASHTITFIGAKPGLLTADGPDHCGELRVAELDLSPTGDVPADGHLVSAADFATHARPRPLNSHKGSFGSAGILGGAHSMVGAAFLAGRAALKLGAGRVYIGLLDPQPPACDLLQPELMLRRPQALLQTELSALACGPGLGDSLEASELLETAIASELPLLLDADAINLVASEGNLQVALASRSNPAILTPHPAEAARLLESGTAEVQGDRIAAALEIAERYHCHVALKGCGTVIARVDGRWWINSTGNPGMATAGMGDVLSGLIVALLAQGWPVDTALRAGVYLHGAAADRLVASGVGPIGLTAGEVIDTARLIFNEWSAA